MTRLIDRLKQCGYIDPTAISVLRFLNPSFRTDSIDGIRWLDFIAFSAFRAGHTALPLDQKSVPKFVRRLLSESPDESLALSQEELEAVTEHLLAAIENKEWERWPGERTYNDEKISLPFSERDDAAIAEEIIRLCSVRAKSAIEIGGHHPIFDRLNPEQIAAVLRSCTAPLSIIHGGPGTGKTHTAGAIIALLAERFYRYMQKDRPQPYRILTAAPTGKAVLNLKKSIQSCCAAAFQSLDIPESALCIDSMTLHSFFFEQKRSHGDIVYHTIIVDEASMIDTKLMRHFLSQVRTGTRLIFLGDPNQLPPIGAGQPFADMISTACRLKNRADRLVQSELSSCVRTDLQSIAALSRAILNGDAGGLFALCRQGAPELLHLSYDMSNSADAAALEDFLYSNAGAIWQESSQMDLNDAIACTTKIKILCPNRRAGPVSTDQINQLLSKRLAEGRKRGKRVSRYLEPVIITKNRPSLHCMNGDLALLESVKMSKNGRYWNKMLHVPTSPSTPFPLALCPDHDLAYAMTIHKSQGSEFLEVIVMIPPQSRGLTRELLYTAVTRSKRRVVLIGQPSDIALAMETQTDRCSALGEYLHNSLSHPDLARC